MLALQKQQVGAQCQQSKTNFRNEGLREDRRWCVKFPESMACWCPAVLQAALVICLT